MKRIVVALLLIAVMLSGMITVHAAEAEVTVEVRASKTEVQIGETVEFTVLATGSGVVAMQFELRCPEGLRYIPNSAATPENLAQKLGVPAADWTEISKMFTFYNDIGITFVKGTELLRFSCVAEKEGTWAPDLYELLPFNGNFEEFPPDVILPQITVTAPVQQTAPSAPEKPTVPAETTAPEENPVPVEPETQPDVPSVTAPTVSQTEKPTETVPDVPDGEKADPTAPTHIQNTPHDEPQDITDDLVTVGPQDQTLPDRDQQNSATKPWVWLISLGLAAVIGGGVVVFILLKKKAS